MGPKYRALGPGWVVLVVIALSSPLRAEPLAPSAKPPSASTTSSGTEAPARAEAPLRNAPEATGPKVKTTEDEGGVKTYTFEAVELEGRLKSPQILYFLRRVRAEFAAQGLGHRSFLRELADTRRHRAIR